MRTLLRVTLAAAAFALAGLWASGSGQRQASADVDLDVSVFYTSLEPHGDWVYLQPYGWSWVPDNVDYGWRPYTVGQWSWVEPYGWTWVSEEPWGWATYHYGRWSYVDDYGWAWVPGTTWGPAWVAFRYGDPWVGWAPMPPGADWRFSAAPDVRSLNQDVSLGAYAWVFAPFQYFTAPDLHARIVLTAHSPYLLQRTLWSTRYTTIEGGYANQSIDFALAERAHRAPVPRRHLRDAPAPRQGTAPHIDRDSVVMYRPRIAPAPPAKPPVPRARGEGRAPPTVDLNAWVAQRQAALKAHLEAQRKALEQPDALPPAPGLPVPGAVPADDAAKRREAALKALEDERKRLESLLERQRKRRELEQQPPPPVSPVPGPGTKDAPPGKKDDPPGKKDDEHGKK